MADNGDDDTHDFVVVGIEGADDETLDGVAVTLTDKRGGRVRLHLGTDMAESLREKLSLALSRLQGP